MKSKIILFEGIPGSGKTTLINELIKKHVHEKDKIKTFLNLSQTHTYTPIISEENSFYASKEAILIHLESILQLLTLGYSLNTDLNCLSFSCLIDTLHITHCFRPGNINWTDVSPFDRKLAEIDCKLILIKALPETIWERAILERSKKDHAYLTKYQSRFGKSLEDIHKYYMTEQMKMEELFELSSLRKLVLRAEETLEYKLIKSYSYWFYDQN